MATLQTILLDSAVYLDREATLPTGTELDNRVRIAVEAVNEWAVAYKWRQLKTELVVTGSTASLALPNYQFLDGFPRGYVSSGYFEEYPEIDPTDRFNKASDEKYSYVTGNDATGFAIHFNNVSVGSTLSIQYIRGASGMATLSDMCEVPDYRFVTKRVISNTLQIRNDERFPIVEADGDRLLRNMISSEMIQLPGGRNTTPKKGIAGYSIG